MISPLLRSTRADADRERLAALAESGDLAPLLAEVRDLANARRRLIADAEGEPDVRGDGPELGDLREPSYWLASVAAVLEHQTAALLALHTVIERRTHPLILLGIGFLLGALASFALLQK